MNNLLKEELESLPKRPKKDPRSPADLRSFVERYPSWQRDYWMKPKESSMAVSNPVLHTRTLKDWGMTAKKPSFQILSEQIPVKFDWMRWPASREKKPLIISEEQERELGAPEEEMAPEHRRIRVRRNDSVNLHERINIDGNPEVEDLTQFNIYESRLSALLTTTQRRPERQGDWPFFDHKVVKRNNSIQELPFPFPCKHPIHVKGEKRKMCFKCHQLGHELTACNNEKVNGFTGRTKHFKKRKNN